MSNIQDTEKPGHTNATASQECRVIASLFAAGMSLIAFVLSLGTVDQPRMEIYFATGITLLAINFPSWMFSRCSQTQLRADLLWAAVLAVLLFLIRRPAPVAVPHALAAIGFVFGTVGILRLFLCGALLRRMVKTAALAGLYIFVVGQFVWGEGYRNPLDLLQFANSGTIHTDPAFHKAVIANLMTHGVCSTGMDGVPAFEYHYAAHFLASRLGLLLGASPHSLVCIVMPILLPSLLLFSVLRVVVVGCELFSGAELPGIASVRGHFLLLAGFGGFLPPVMLFSILNWNWSFTMDSQIMAMMIVAISLLAMRSFTPSQFGQELWAFDSRPHSRPQMLFVAAVTIAVLTATKVTVAHLYTLGFLYLTIRSVGKTLSKLTIVAICVGTLLICSSFFAARTSRGIYLAPLSLWFERVPLTSWALMIPINAFFGLTYFVIRTYRARISTYGDLLVEIKSRRLLDAEVVVLMSLCGALLTGVFGGKLATVTIYYLCAAQFAAIVAAGILDLYPRVCEPRPVLRNVPIVSSVTRVFFALLFLTAAVSSLEKWRDISRLNLQSRGAQFAVPLGSPAEPGKTEMRVMLRQGKLNDVVDAAKKNTKHTEKRILDGDRFILGVLSKLSEELTFEEKQVSALWVPRTNREFWDLSRKGKRWLLPMIAVGIAEVAMIDGCPEEWEPIADGDAFGFSAYPRVPVTHETALALDDALAKARGWGFHQVLELKESGQIVRHECR